MRRSLVMAGVALLMLTTGCGSDDGSEATGASLSDGAGGSDGTTSSTGYTNPGPDASSAADTQSSWGPNQDAGNWGSTGTDGTSGTTGTTGTSGADGWDGADATDGWDATDGADGWDGTDGTDGTTGTDGATGTGGTTGGTGSQTGPNGECIPACNGKQCGPDGCGGSCGWCGGGDSCQGGSCVAVPGCSPDCADAMVGADDGCGGVCSGSGFGIGLVPGGAQDAAYFRSRVLAGQIPEPHLLPIEGWLTEHGTALPEPETDRLVTLHAFAGLFYDPEEGEPTVAVQLGMNSGISPEAIEEGQFNLSVVIDRSGSMAEDGKMEFVKAGLIKMLDSLDDQDTLSIVTYSTGANVVLEPTPVADKAAIIAIIEGINTGGKTNLWGGLKLGYEQVMKNVAKKQLTPRVILLSDGLVNEGITDESAILAGSESYNNSGIGVTTIGVGASFNQELMHLLATKAGGNFYFLDTGDKLAQVFEQEITYLLTPVADNLQVWFSLPSGFGVEDIYGFEFKNEDGDFHLLGPSPQATIGPDGEVAEPLPGGEEPEVAVSTLFASKKNGLLMVKLQSPGPSVLQDFENLPLTSIYYSYELVDSGETESFDVPVNIGSLEYDEGEGFHYFSGATMQRNFCILRAGLAMKTASTMFHEDPVGNLQAALTQLGYARTFCEGINVQLNDAKIVEDVALMLTLMDNICGDTCLDPAGN